MYSSTRKRQDENNLKILRELGTETANKFCFDCGQRGPTYVNVTIGSFVCTKCSGILRGLTPPHRVKSISMATFSADEINTMRTKGNDYCKKIWLALHENSLPILSGDEQAIRDFMVNKYEHKRYYLEEGAVKAEQSSSTSSSSSSTVTSMSNGNSKIANGIKNGLCRNNKVIKGIKSNGAVTYRSRPEAKNNYHNNNNNSENLGNNFANFEQADIFSNNSSPSTNSTQTQNGFADFEHNSVYNASSNGMPTSTTLNVWTNQKPPINPQNGLGSAPLVNSTVEDKYAALKDLDNEMKQQQHQHQHQELWSSSNTGSTGSLYSSSTPTTGSVYGSPSPQGSSFGSPSQGQFMSAFTAFQECSNNPQMANPFNANGTMNPWATCNSFNSSANNRINNSTNSNNNSSNNATNCLNGLNGTKNNSTQGQAVFVNPFKEQNKINDFSNILPQPNFPSNGLNGSWSGSNPFKVGAVSMNSNNPFL